MVPVATRPSKMDSRFQKSMCRRCWSWQIASSQHPPMLFWFWPIAQIWPTCVLWYLSIPIKPVLQKICVSESIMGPRICSRTCLAGFSEARRFGLVLQVEASLRLAENYTGSSYLHLADSYRTAGQISFLHVDSHRLTGKHSRLLGVKSASKPVTVFAFASRNACLPLSGPQTTVHGAGKGQRSRIIRHLSVRRVDGFVFLSAMHGLSPARFCGQVCALRGPPEEITGFTKG